MHFTKGDFVLVLRSQGKCIRSDENVDDGGNEDVDGRGREVCRVEVDFIRLATNP